MKRVLVVDDQSDCSEPMARLLKLCGFDTQTAANGREALDKLSHWSADLVLLDLMMPVMDGFAFLEAIRGRPQWSALPVVVFSAWDNDQTRHRLQRLGVAQTYRKADTDFDTMVKEIKQLVGVK
jgi:CheY-like chemotaxis protein